MQHTILLSESKTAISGSLTQAWEIFNFQPQFLLQFSFLHRLTFHKLRWASNKIVKYIYILYIKVYTLKLFVYMQKITRICRKSVKNVKNPKETLDSGVLTIKLPSSVLFASSSDSILSSWFTSSLTTLLFKGQVFPFWSCPKSLHISNCLVHSQFRAKSLGVKNKFVAYVV